jgi:hypothetical protein
MRGNKYKLQEAKGKDLMWTKQENLEALASRFLKGDVTDRRGEGISPAGLCPAEADPETRAPMA